MEKSTVMKAFNGIGSLSQQQPISDVMEPSLPCISFPQKTNLRDASFSSYLKPYESNQVVDDSEISIFDAQKYFNESNNDAKVSKRVSPVKVINLEHISERCNLSAVPRFSSASSADGYGRNYRAHSFHATPTASSEASWNSQTGLLSNPPGAIAVSMRNPNTANTDEKVRRTTTKWLLGQKCPCSSKKSVQVEDKLSQPKTPARSNTNSNASFNTYNHKRQTSKSVEIATGGERREVINLNPHTRISGENRSSSLLGQRVLASGGRPFSEAAGFTFPILNQSSPVKLVLNATPSPSTLEDPPRDSLEVFIPSNEPIMRKAAVPRQSFTFLGSPKSRMTITDDDVASDASSDLFEIESFSTQTTTYPMYHRRDSLDEASSFNARRLAAATNGGLYVRESLDEPMTQSIAPTECYEPSEASIDWSVTTAEGFDRASVTNFSVTAPEVEDMTFVRYESEKYSTGGGGGGVGVGKRGGSGGKKKGSGLLSCRCEKAVSVGPHPIKCIPERQKVGPPIPASTTLRHVSSRPPNVNKPPLARSHSARLSLTFAT